MVFYKFTDKFQKNPPDFSGGSFLHINLIT